MVVLPQVIGVKDERFGEEVSLRNFGICDYFMFADSQHLHPYGWSLVSASLPEGVCVRRSSRSAGRLSTGGGGGNDTVIATTCVTEKAKPLSLAIC